MSAQAVGLHTHFSRGTVTVTRDTLCWIGDLSPDEYARTYAVEMRYRRGDAPQVWVRAPNLHALTGGRRLPHVYDQKEQRLCLFVPGCGFWRPDHALARTILPWACYWLRLFELWLVTGTWHERGVHPQSRKPSQRQPHSPGTIL